MDYYNEYNFQVGSRSVDQYNRCRPSAILAYLQEAATSASVDLGISREFMMERHNVFWMLARIWYRIDRPLGWADTLQIRTWHRGGKGVTMYRDYDLFVGGEPVGEAVSAWVLADWDTKKMLRMNAVPEFKTTTGGSLCKEIQLHKLSMPENLALCETRLMRDSDTDINGHINNAHYANFATDALALERLDAAQFVHEMQVGFLAECRPGELLTLHTGAQDGAQYVHGIGPDEVPRFDVKVNLSTH